MVFFLMEGNGHVVGNMTADNSYRQILWTLEDTKLDVIMIVPPWNLTGISAALLTTGACQFSGQLEKSKLESCGFEA